MKQVIETNNENKAIKKIKFTYVRITDKDQPKCEEHIVFSPQGINYSSKKTWQNMSDSMSCSLKGGWSYKYNEPTNDYRFDTFAKEIIKHLKGRDHGQVIHGMKRYVEITVIFEDKDCFSGLISSSESDYNELIGIFNKNVPIPFDLPEFCSMEIKEEAK